MRRQLPARFWLEIVLAAVGAVLLAVSLVSLEWIEELTGWDPDGGSGALEVAIPVLLLAVAAASAWSARRTYVRSAAAS